jgi:hypothetical protein
VIALRDIQPGEEILISYLDSSLEKPYAERQKRLSEQWKFNCTCPVCSGGKIIESDKRMKEITKAKERLSKSYGRADKIIKYAKELVELYRDEEMWVPLPQWYEVVAYTSNHLGNDAEMREFAELAKKHWTILLGKDAPQVRGMEALLDDPESHPSHPSQNSRED